jgi:hypothetical protein
VQFIAPNRRAEKAAGWPPGPAFHDCKMSKISALDRARMATITLFAGNANYFVQYCLDPEPPTYEAIHATKVGPPFSALTAKSAKSED